MSLFLDYHDALIYRSDLALLQPGQWLNDRVINFCYRYFEHEDPVVSKAILLVDPAVVSFLRIQCAEDAEYHDLYRSLELNDREYVLLPCSDSSSFDAMSTHWSLVVYHVSTSTASHIDSYHGYNTSSAERIAEKLQRLYRSGLFLPCSVLLMFSQSNAFIFSRLKDPVKLLLPEVPQQENGYDCGIFTILASLHVVKAYLAGATLTDCVGTLTSVVSQDIATSYRDELDCIIRRCQHSSKMNTSKK